MKPVDRFDEHVDRRRQIVAATHVTQFVRDDGLQLRLRQATGDTFRQQQDRSDDAEHSRLNSLWSGHDPDWQVDG
jgi:hypothetical protein